jgi:hypothetical protein
MKKFLLTGMLLWAAVAVKAQDNIDDGRDEQIKAIEIGYFTKELNLTPDEAQKFWPVFNQYKDEVRKVRLANKSDIIKLQEAELNVTKQFRPNFLKAINPDKFERFLRARAHFENAIRKEFIRRKMLQRRRG